MDAPAGSLGAHHDGILRGKPMELRLTTTTVLYTSILQ